MIFNTGYWSDSGSGLSYGGSGTYDSPILSANAENADTSEIWDLPQIVGAYYKALDTSKIYQWNGIRFVGLDGAADLVYTKSGTPYSDVWSSGTDEEVVEMVAAADAGKMDLSDYWAVGDTRAVTLSAMSATGVGESHAAQEVEMTIMGFGGKTLSGGGACNAIVGLKDCLNEAGYMNSSATSSGGWASCARRAWCNDVFYGALPSGLKGIFKKFHNYTGQYSGSVTDTEDYFALPAEYEVFGSTAYSAGSESSNLSRFEWYETSANRVKKANGSAGYWWERSPRSSGGIGFCTVNGDGAANISSASYTYGLSPFGCI